MPALFLAWLIACGSEPADRPAPPPEKNAAGLIEGVDAFYGPELGPYRTTVFVDRTRATAGEVVRVSSWTLDSDELPATGWVVHRLICAHGGPVSAAWVALEDGHAHSELVVPDTMHPGDWKVQVSYEGRTAERPLVVRSSARPRYKVEWGVVEDEERFGPQARMSVLHLDGEPARFMNLLVMSYPSEPAWSWMERQRVQTDSHGVALVPVPERALGGVTMGAWFASDGAPEGVGFAVPGIRLRGLPVGGRLVSGLPNAFSIEVHDSDGRPWVGSGAVRIDRRRPVEFTTNQAGHAELVFTPEPDRDMRVELDGVFGAWRLESLMSPGSCTLQVHDHTVGSETEIRAGVRCLEEQTVIVAGLVGDGVLDAADYKVIPGAETEVVLGGPTLDGDIQLLLIPPESRTTVVKLPHPAKPSLGVTIERGGPVEEALVGVQVVGPEGRPLAGELAVSVVQGEAGPRALPSLSSISRIPGVGHLLGRDLPFLRRLGALRFVEGPPVGGRRLELGESGSTYRDEGSHSGGAPGNANPTIDPHAIRFGRHPPQPGGWDQQTLILWEPRLSTDPQGRATILVPQHLMTGDGPVSVHVHAMGEGMVGGGHLLLD